MGRAWGRAERPAPSAALRAHLRKMGELASRCFVSCVVSLSFSDSEAMFSSYVYVGYVVVFMLIGLVVEHQCQVLV